MAFELLSDASPAAWITGDQSPWTTLVSLGPAGFEAYGRLRFLPDPERPGQREGDVNWERPPYDGDQWPALLTKLLAHTTTPADCYVCLWEGWPLTPRPASRPAVRVLGSRGEPDGYAARAYYLFRGPLADLVDWRTSDAQGYEPAFIWPADHTWCVANDVDTHYAGIASNQAVIDALILNSAINVVAAEFSAQQPCYS